MAVWAAHALAHQLPISTPSRSIKAPSLRQPGAYSDHPSFWRYPPPWKATGPRGELLNARHYEMQAQAKGLLGPLDVAADAKNSSPLTSADSGGGLGSLE